MTTSLGDQIAAAMQARDFDLAAQLIGPFVEPTRQEFGDRHEKTASALNWFGCICQLTERLDEAVAAYEQALDIGTEDPTSDLAVMMRANLAEVHELMGNASAARTMLAQALALHAQRTGPAYRGLGDVFKQTAVLSEAAGDLDDAERLLLKALQVTVDTGLEGLLDDIRIHLTRVLLKRGDFTTAAGLRDQVLARISGDMGWRAAWPISSLMHVLRAVSEIEKSEAGATFVRESLLAMEPFIYDDEPKANERLRWMADGLESVGELREAERLRQRAARLSPWITATG
jgi:tetratricopeptide (TPR) repeat protein